ncbi:hypothetical protein OAE79_00675 [Rhodopirellula sp.]|nr:hypothetical protein [Rhodopirellula sp.]MDB4678824.1 hypothetical protein [Rhodopirellula sp.]
MTNKLLRSFVLAGTAFLIVSATAFQAAAGIAIQANYLDDAGEGFYDSTYGSDRQTAFEYALDIWGNALQPTYAGETIVIDARFDSLGGSSTSATLGAASPNSYHNLNNTNKVMYASALGNHLQGLDITNSGTGSEGQALFNSDIDSDSSVLTGYSWYYGTDDNAGANQFDFVSTVLHEIGHALGFAGLIEDDGGYDDFSGQTDGTYYSQYDYFVVRTSDSTPLRNLSEDDRIEAATSDNISWAGADGVAANGGSLVKLYAPGTWEQGSSYSHLDESTFSTELMSPQYTIGTGHEISSLTLGMMSDMGWSIVVPEPGTFAVWSFMIVTVGISKRRRRTKRQHVA